MKIWCNILAKLTTNMVFEKNAAFDKNHEFQNNC